MVRDVWAQVPHSLSESECCWDTEHSIGRMSQQRSDQADLWRHSEQKLIGFVPAEEDWCRARSSLRDPWCQSEVMNLWSLVCCWTTAPVSPAHCLQGLMGVVNPIPLEELQVLYPWSKPFALPAWKQERSSSGIQYGNNMALLLFNLTCSLLPVYLVPEITIRDVPPDTFTFCAKAHGNQGQSFCRTPPQATLTLFQAKNNDYVSPPTPFSL